MLEFSVLRPWEVAEFFPRIQSPHYSGLILAFGG
jgi:hypothetical protein